MPEHDCFLSVATLVTGYGKKQVLNGVSLEVPRGKIVTLVGQNGAGKSTLLKAVIGLLPIWRGQVSLGGNVLHTPKPRDLLCAGVSYIPQGNRVFTHLTVRENLEVAGTTLPNKAQLRGAIDRALRLFTDLRPRMGQYAGTLSGGEKQMLALASALVLGPRLLLMDEPSLGLAPQLVERLLRHIWEINKESGVTVLIVEQKVREVLKIAHRVYVLRNGQVSFDGPTESLDDTKLREAYF